VVQKWHLMFEHHFQDAAFESPSRAATATLHQMQVFPICLYLLNIPHYSTIFHFIIIATLALLLSLKN